MALMTGKLNNINAAIKKATHSLSVLKTEAPRYVKTKASAI